MLADGNVGRNVATASAAMTDELSHCEDTASGLHGSEANGGQRNTSQHCTSKPLIYPTATSLMIF